MGLLRTLLIIVIVYDVFKFVGRYILPLFLKKMVDNVEQKFKEQQEQQKPESTMKVGETVIDSKPKNHKEGNKNLP